jgi:hypothetical protein
MADGPVQEPSAGVNLIPKSGIYEFGYSVPGLSFEPSELDPHLPLGPGGGDTLACGEWVGGTLFRRRNRHSGTLCRGGQRYFFWGCAFARMLRFFSSASARSRFQICQCAKRYSAIAEASAWRYPPPQIIKRL